MLYFKSLAINTVDLCQKMLTSVLTFNLLIINVVDLVDLYPRIYILRSWIASMHFKSQWKDISPREREYILRIFVLIVHH